MFTALALIATLSAPEKITLSTGCKRLPVILKQLSARTSTELRCTTAFEDEVIFLSIKERSLDDVLKRLAEVTHGDWEKSGAIYVLKRSSRQTAQDEKAETT